MEIRQNPWATCIIKPHYWNILTSKVRFGLITAINHLKQSQNIWIKLIQIQFHSLLHHDLSSADHMPTSRQWPLWHAHTSVDIHVHMACFGWHGIVCKQLWCLWPAQPTIGSLYHSMTMMAQCPKLYTTKAKGLVSLTGEDIFSSCNWACPAHPKSVRVPL